MFMLQTATIYMNANRQKQQQSQQPAPYHDDVGWVQYTFASNSSRFTVARHMLATKFAAAAAYTTYDMMMRPEIIPEMSALPSEEDKRRHGNREPCVPVPYIFIFTTMHPRVTCVTLSRVRLW